MLILETDILAFNSPYANDFFGSSWGGSAVNGKLDHSIQILQAGDKLCARSNQELVVAVLAGKKKVKNGTVTDLKSILDLHLQI